MKESIETLGIIAGSGRYPELLVGAARRARVRRLVVAAFHEETAPELERQADAFVWLRIGQLGKLISFFRENQVRHAVMAGQIAPKNLFTLRPDLKALLLLARLKRRNAESIFGAVAKELQKAGVELLPATAYLEDLIPKPGLVAGPAPGARALADVAFGFRIAKEVSRLDIGQTVVVKNGTVLAVEGFEGTDAAIRRGGALGHGKAVAVKVSKPGQDFRFDVPVIGLHTLAAAAEAGVSVVACEAGRALLLDKDALRAKAEVLKVSLFAADPSVYE